MTDARGKHWGQKPLNRRGKKPVVALVDLNKQKPVRRGLDDLGSVRIAQGTYR